MPWSTVVIALPNDPLRPGRRRRKQITTKSSARSRCADRSDPRLLRRPRTPPAAAKPAGDSRRTRASPPARANRPRDLDRPPPQEDARRPAMRPVCGSRWARSVAGRGRAARSAGPWDGPRPRGARRAPSSVSVVAHRESSARGQDDPADAADEVGVSGARPACAARRHSPCPAGAAASPRRMPRRAPSAIHSARRPEVEHVLGVRQRLRVGERLDRTFGGGDRAATPAGKCVARRAWRQSPFFPPSWRTVTMARSSNADFRGKRALVGDLPRRVTKRGPDRRGRCVRTWRSTASRSTSNSCSSRTATAARATPA